jgi:diguanylate cyclase (GGDEF)-like protein
MDRRPSGTTANARKPARRESEGLWDWNLASNRIHFSPGWIALAGCHEHEVGSSPDEWFTRVHPDDSQQLQRDIEAARQAPTCDFDLRYRLRHKDGTYRWMSSRGLVVRDDSDEAIRLTGAQTDVTVETVTDTLTGLPNRLLLLDRLSQSIARTRRHSSFHFALVLIELGRPAGPSHTTRPSTDPLLNGAARRLETCLRLPEAGAGQRQNDLVARVEGDRFAVLLDGLTDLTHAKVVADGILALMLTPFAITGREIRLSPAIGIALSATGYSAAEDALRDAETAMHRARVLGGSHCEVFDSEVLKSAQSALQLESELELALQRNELELFYQPIVSIASHRIVGFEALVRWRHSVLGLISPLDFIPVAERTGLIVPLGQWILQEACAQLRTWQTNLPLSDDLWVSVNLSAVQLKEPDIGEQVEDALRRSDLQPRSLVLELTEGAAMEDPVAVTTLLMRLRATGVRVSIDDFGTGYSSLAYLRQFPIDALKIDQSFVRGIANDKDTAAIVAGIVAMAKELGLSVVAEGVENEAQMAVLRSLHCGSAQGYLFAEPLNVARAEEFLRAGPSIDVARRDRPVNTSSWPTSRLGLQHLYALTRPRVGGRELVMAGAVLAMLASTGAAKMFYGKARSAGQPDPAVVQLSTSADAPQAEEIDDTFVSNSPAAEPEQPRIPPATAPASQNDAAVNARPAPAAAVPAAAAPAVKAGVTSKSPASFDVVHLHKLGRCRGRLVVSGEGVEFVTDKQERSDAFTLKHGDFVQSADKDTLTIRSADKTYRFTLAAAPATDSGGHTPEEVIEAITRSRGK